MQAVLVITVFSLKLVVVDKSCHQDMNEGIDDVTLTDMINEVDLNQNGKLELDEFLEVVKNLYFKRYLKIVLG